MHFASKLALAAAAATLFVAPSVLADEPLAPTFAEPSEAEIAGEIAVDLRDDVSPADIAAIGRDYGITLIPNSPAGDPGDKIERATVPFADEAALIARLAKDPRVEYAEPMTLVWASFAPNDPLYASKQWHLKRVGAESAWEYGCGRGVTVAIVDTGVACFDKGPFTKGSDLAGTRCVPGWNFIADNADASDDQGHGTHVAGTVAQTTNNAKGVAGLAYCATLLPVKVLNGRGFGSVAGVAQGIRYAADHGAQIINLSLGGPSKSRILESAVRYAIGKGVLVVAAAGNSGRSVGYPAAYPGVLAVSATDQNDKLAWFSSRGPEVSIAAPGVAVTQQTICDGGRNKCELFAAFNGTSMATPHVAGSAALLAGQGITDPDAIRRTLARSATSKGNPEHYGAGLLDADAAVKRAYWAHFALRLGALALLGTLIFRRIREKGGSMKLGLSGLLAALFTSTGLFFAAPLTGLVARAGGMRTAIELAMRPLGEWDMVFDLRLHRFLPLANALPALALVGVFFGVKRLRPLVGGVALGSAAFLAQQFFSADVATPIGSFGTRLWVLANAALCLWLARMALDEART